MKSFIRIYFLIKYLLLCIHIYNERNIMNESSCILYYNLTTKFIIELKKK